MEYIFFGKIIPSFKRIEFNISDPPLRATINSEMGTFTYKLLLNDTDTISVVVESENELKDLSTLVFLVTQYTQSFYDTAFFISGVICTVRFSSLMLPNQIFASVNTGDFSNWHDKKLFAIPTEKLFALNTNSIVRVATSDIKNGCLEFDMTAFYCYQAIEAIMNSFSNDDAENRKVTWDKMRDSLNIDRQFFADIEKFSIANRHGKPFNQTWEIREKCLYSAMIVLQRYMHYLDEGQKRLEAEKYPIVTTIQDVIKK